MPVISPRPVHRAYDAVVVGSGAAGGWAAKELCEGGLDVLLLEAGRPISPEIDYPAPAPRPRRLQARLIALAAGQSVQMRCAAFDARTRRFFVSDRDHPYTTPPGAPFNWFRGRQVGGRLHTWARVIPRLSDYELGAAGRDGYGVDWPLTYDELAPYYDRVESFLGAYGERDGLPGVPDGCYLGAIPLTAPERHFRATIAGSFPRRRVIAARLAVEPAGRVPSTLVAAERTGRLELRPDTVVREVCVDPRSGRATGVSCVDLRTRTRIDFTAKLVVLCASTIETLRIMLNSHSERHPAGLGNSSGRLGRYVMDQVLTGIGGRHPGSAECTERDDPYDSGGMTGFQIPRFHNLGGLDAEFLRGYGVQGGIGRETPHWYLMAHGEMLARAENRVTLHPSGTDAWGVPAAHIDCTAGANERAMAGDQLRTMHELAQAAGLKPSRPPSGRVIDKVAFKLWRSRLLSPHGAFLPGSAAHESGGAGMGDDPSRFVLNRFNRCWDADNLVVTDGAAFPCGCWQNATLTIMALTVRACDHLLAEYAAGRV